LEHSFDYLPKVLYTLSQVGGTKTKGRDRETWNECVKVDMKRLGFVQDVAHNSR